MRGSKRATSASAASYNTHLGVPLTLARVPRSARYAVVEIGTNHPGEIEPLSRQAQPHVCIITTIAGTGIAGIGGHEIPAVNSALNMPTAVAADATGNIYITERKNLWIRKIDAAGIITAIAGTGDSGWTGNGGPAMQAQLVTPFGVAADGSGYVYFSEYEASAIRRFRIER